MLRLDPKKREIRCGFSVHEVQCVYIKMNDKMRVPDGMQDHLVVCLSPASKASYCVMNAYVQILVYVGVVPLCMTSTQCDVMRYIYMCVYVALFFPGSMFLTWWAQLLF